MAVLFDPVNKHIKITSGTYISALTIYNATMDWCDARENIGYDVPMRAVGKAPLGGGVYTDSIFILQNGWKIKLYDGTYTFTVLGTLITDDETSRTVPPDFGNVEVIFQVSSQATIIPDEAEWTQIEKDGILSDIGVIKPKVEKLPSDPASITAIDASEKDVKDHVEEEADNIREHVTGEVDDLITREKGLDEIHGEVKDGNPNSLLEQIRQLLEGMSFQEVKKPESISDYLDSLEK